MYGFPEEFMIEAARLTSKEKLALFCDTIPKHLVKRIITTIQLAEQQASEEAMVEHGERIGELEGKADANCLFYSNREEGQAPFSYTTTRVINRWTTFPLPSKEQWQEASKMDTDIGYLID